MKDVIKKVDFKNLLKKHKDLELSKVLGVTVASVNSYRHGKAFPNEDNFIKMLRYIFKDNFFKVFDKKKKVILSLSFDASSGCEVLRVFEKGVLLEEKFYEGKNMTYLIKKSEYFN